MNKPTANSSVMTSRRRPKRQRTPTTIYTDDNPTTFTTKKKKGQHDKDDNDGGSRRHSTGKLTTGNSSVDVDSHSRSRWSDIQESMSMPPPAPVLKRGPGRPPSRRKSIGKILSGGDTTTRAPSYATTKTTVVPNSSASSSQKLSAAKASAAVEAQHRSSEPVATKRKRGRPPKNRSKEILPEVNANPSTVESDLKSKSESGTKASSNETTGVKGVNDSSTTDSQQDDDPVVDDTNDVKANRRRSLPESSSEPKVNDTGRSRRSLDTLLSSKKDLKCSIIINNTGTKVGSTRISNIKQRRTKSGKFRSRTSNSSTSWTLPQQDIEGTFINHSVTVAPILPPVIIRDNDDDNVGDNGNKTTNDDRREKPIYDDNDDSSYINISSESRGISREIKSKYPVVFDKDVPKSSSCIAPPFSSTSQISSSGASSASSSKHKSNQSQNQSQLPTWSPLYKPPVFFEDDYDQETGNLDIENTIPVTRHITAMTVRKPDHDYLVLGDSVGFVTVYSLAKDNITLPIAQLESMACQQRGKPEQERLRADLLKRKKQTKGKGGSGSNKLSSSFKFSNSSRPGTPNQMQMNNPFASGPHHGRSIVIDTSDTTIHALGMIKNRVVLATGEELECMDVPSGTSLWVCPLSSNRFVTSLDMHLDTFDVLVSCSKTLDTADEVAAPVSPLMLLQHSEDNVEICDANSPMLVRSPSCTAIWDVGQSNRLLFIALSSNRQEHELVLVSGGSIDSWKVACKTKIPTKASSNVAAVSQSPGGIYTLVASSRGIRLYQTESLQLIHVYGDQLALHGQSVTWKDCWLAGSFFSEKNENINKAARGLPSQWLQCDDWLGEMIGKTTTNEIESAKPHDSIADKEEKNTPNLAPYIIGVPHTKGPKELCANLHVWNVEHPSVVPMMSIPLPHKAEGALGLVGSGNNNSRSNNSTVTEDRIVLVTDEGEGHLLLPKMESNFAGIVYPPGYQVVTDNLEYIEDEEATDHVICDDVRRGKSTSDDETEDVDILGDGDDEESMDEELREAMRQSLLEHKKSGLSLEMIEGDEDVDILGITNGQKDREFLPCRPEPYLRQMVNAIIEGEEIPEDERQEERDIIATNGKASNLYGIDETEASKTVTMKPKMTDAIFISNVLGIMPNMPKIKPMEEDCLSFTTTKVVIAVNPVARGRGRKSRAANLETMLKASINPYLQSMMLSRQGVPVNGKGSQLGVIRRQNSKNKLKRASGSFYESNAGTERVNGESYSCDSSVSGLNVKPSSSPRHATNDDEAAVVMGLLGLSPCHTPNVPSNTFVSSDSKEVQIGASATNGQPKGSTYLNSSSLSLLGVRNDDNQVVSALSSERGSQAEGSETLAETTVEKSKLDIIDKSCSACRGRLVIHTCGKRSLPIDYEEIARVERERKEKEEEEKKRIRAEKRRLTDQKRKQKKRELEEQRLREENERLETEQRRRLQEDFAAQDLNRNRREQIVASYERYQTNATNGVHSLEYGKMKNVEVTSSAHSTDIHHQFTQPQTNTNDIEQGNQLVQQHAQNGQAGVTYQINPSDNSQHLSTSSEHACYSMPSRSPLAQATLPSISTTFAAVDALGFLANLADYTENLPVTESCIDGFGTPSNEPVYATSGNGTVSNTREPTVNQYNVPAFEASHGFSDAVSSNFGGEVKRGIPSYATIRGDQFSNGSPNDVASVLPNMITASYSHQTGESKVHSRPARSNDKD